MAKKIKTALEMCKFIDDWSKEAEGDESSNLWKILTALRGPDNEDEELKYTTTAVIRGASLPSLSGMCGGLIETDPNKYNLYRNYNGGNFRYGNFRYGHFKYHAVMAAKVLNLKNKDE